MAPNPILTEAVEALTSGRDLSSEEAARVLREVMEGRASETQTAALLIALRAKGETVEELVGLARTMRALATRVEVDREHLLDTAGTGGGHHTFNVSTAAALVAAGAGASVAKHGNRSATSLSGSADVLEALGARIDLAPEATAECITEVGFGFMFAPHHHSAMRYVAPVRRELGVRTVFNFLGPLTNPAGAGRQVIGVADPELLETMAAALAALGCERGLVVSSEDGLDELSVSGVTRVVEVGPEGTRRYKVEPEDVGLRRASHDTVAGGRPEANAEATRSVLAGEEGARRDLVALNAGAALYAVGRAASLEEGVRLAEETIDSGAATETLERYVERTRALAPEEGKPA